MLLLHDMYREAIHVRQLYQNFDLQIDRAGNAYRARVLYSPAGQAGADFTLPFAQSELSLFLALQSRDSQSGPESGVALSPRQFGERLFRAVFTGPIGTCLSRSRDAAESAGTGLRLNLRLDDVPELAALPWEYLYDPERGRFLALSAITPVVRYLALGLPEHPLRVDLPLHILAVLSDPTDVAPRLNVQDEWQRLQDALAPLTARDLLVLERLDQPAIAALQARLREGDVHVLHFVGHGAYVGEQGMGYLLLEDAAGCGQWVSADKLGTLLGDHPALHLAFVNVCEGALTGDRPGADPFGGTAQTLVRQGVPAVIAMQFEISDGAASGLAGEFYRALADGYPVDAALAEARKSLYLAGDEIEWGTPVLFSRSPDNELIELSEANASPANPRQLFEPETLLIPAGPFPMGTNDRGVPAWETPQHSVNLPAYRIGQYPVTNREYTEFIRREKAQDVPEEGGWFLREPPADRLDHPVTGVSWRDAVAYCRWLSQATGRSYRLPAEAEWEKAASWARDPSRGGAGNSGAKRRYPWGDEWDEGRCNSGSAGTVPVSAHPAGASPSGCEDMLGNAQEWTASLWGTQPAQPEQSYEDRPGGGESILDPADLPVQARMVHRGGSYKSRPAELRCTARRGAAPDSKVPWRGFRVAMQIEA